MSDQQPKTESKGLSHVVWGVGLVAVFFFVLGIFVQLLWNWLMPEIFGLRAITYLQAVGLMLLTRLLFGTVGKKRDHSGYLTGKYGFKGLFSGSGKAES
jgi:hypothetical protein